MNLEGDEFLLKETDIFFFFFFFFFFLSVGFTV
jgi:hypothetical protein